MGTRGKLSYRIKRVHPKFMVKKRGRNKELHGKIKIIIRSWGGGNRKI